MSNNLLYIQTPITLSQNLKNKLNKNIYFKLDALQPTGSFKIRGIGKLCQQYKDDGYTKFVSSSGGNAGIAVAYAGMMLNTPTKVFIPKSSNKLYINIIKSYGADINIIGNNWDEAHKAALDYAEQNKSGYVPPFDHPVLWQGHSTIMDECKASIEKPDVVVVAVGGGGLACGVLEGMHNNGWQDVPVITTETIGADCFYQANQANKIISLEHITSSATSLGAKTVCSKLFDWREKHKIITYRTTDDIAAKACYEFAKDKRILTELAAGSALSVVYEAADIINQYNNILVIVCGGVNTEFLLKT